MQNALVLYPSPDIGHIVSMVELAKLILRLSTHHFSIKILLINGSFWDSPTVTSCVTNISQTQPSISFHRLPPVHVDPAPPSSKAAMAFESIRLNVSNVLHSLKEILTTNRISAFVIDLFCSSALCLGNDLNIPTYYFFTSGAACLAAFLYFPRIHEQNTKSFKDLTDTLLHFLVLSPLKALHMPEPTLDRNDPAYHDMVYFCSHLPKADGIIVNTFDDLEPKAIKSLADGEAVPTPPFYYIGPLIVGGGESDHADQHDCLSWLDKQPSKSVVFLCFGSRGSFSVEQLREIADGLERSGQRFLWVVKKPPLDAKRKQQSEIPSSDLDLDAVLLDGFCS